MRILLLLIISFTSLLELYGQTLKNDSYIVYDTYHISGDDTISNQQVYLIFRNKPWRSPRDNSIIEDCKLITWEFTENNEKFTEHTGIKQTEKGIFLHPIRLKEFGILEFCPFPRVEFPLKTGAQWQWTLRNIALIYFKSLKKSPSIPYEEFEVINNYRVEKKTSYFLPDEMRTIDCYLIKAVGNTVLGKAELEFYFSETYGFLQMEFKTLNEDTYLFKRKRASLY